MVCQKERHAEPILSVLYVSKPTSADGALFTGMETYDDAMAVRLKLLSQKKLIDHVCIFSPTKSHSINKIVFGSSRSQRALERRIGGQGKEFRVCQD